jgi:hypothetical protein
VQSSTAPDSTVNGIASISWDYQGQHFELREEETNAMDTEVKQNLRESLREVTPAHKLGFQFFETAVDGVYAFDSTL